MFELPQSSGRWEGSLFRFLLDNLKIDLMFRLLFYLDLLRLDRTDIFLKQIFKTSNLIIFVLKLLTVADHRLVDHFFQLDNFFPHIMLYLLAFL